MKPIHSYLSLSKVGNKIRLLLFITFLSQLFYFSVSNLRIPVPAKLVEVWANSLLPQELAIEINNLRIIGMSRVDFGKLRLLHKERVIIDLDDLLVSFQSTWPLDKPLFLINSLQVSNAVLFPEQNEVSRFEFSNFSINNRSKQTSLILHTNFRLAHLKSRLNFEIQSIDQILENHLVKKDPTQKRLEETIDSLVILKKNIFQFLHNVPAITTDISGKLNEKHVELYISQSSESINENIGVKNFTSHVYLSNIDKNKTNFSFLTKADGLIHTLKAVKLDFDNLHFSGKGSVENKDFTVSSVDAHLSYENLLMSGKLSGNAPPLDIYLQKKDHHIFTNLFSDKNGTKLSLSAQNSDGEWSTHGTIKLTPDKHDLYALLPHGELRILDGDELNIRFFKNLTPRRKGSSTQFILFAKNLSVLEATSGNFRFSGEISSSLSVYIDEARGKMGRSQVRGTYSQKWNPAKFRFLLNGTCYPPDIDNWLGVWWPPIWKDFVFSQKIPVGDFSISGIWAGPPGNSLTIGRVKTEEISFRSVPIISSEVNVVVDKESTRIRGKNVKHKHGTLDGNLIFPRALTKSETQLEFSIDGIFPVNDAKAVFGKEVEDALGDLNATSLYCEASGEIMTKNDQESNNHNQSWYDLYVSSDDPFSFNRMKVDYAHGKISRVDGLTKAEFDDLGIADGKANFTFREVSPSSDLISISLDLKDAKKNKFLSNLSNSSNWQNASALIEDEFPNIDNTQSKKKQDGKIDLSFQAQGPISNPRYFEGSGTFLLHDVDIGSIHFLGGIRSKLGAFNLPLPSDAFNFNRLEVPFLIEHERVIFDQASLLGPLSKLVANGEVNWINREVDLLANFQLAGNLKIPVLKQIVNLADPLSKLSKLKIQGNWDNPDWSIHLGTNPLSP